MQLVQLAVLALRSPFVWGEAGSNVETPVVSNVELMKNFVRLPV